MEQDSSKQYIIIWVLRVHQLVDIEPTKIKPTEINNGTSLERVVNRLYMFLLIVKLVDDIPLIHQWIREGGRFDHSPIFLNFEG